MLFHVVLRTADEMAPGGTVGGSRTADSFRVRVRGADGRVAGTELLGPAGEGSAWRRIAPLPGDAVQIARRDRGAGMPPRWLRAVAVDLIASKEHTFMAALLQRDGSVDEASARGVSLRGEGVAGVAPAAPAAAVAARRRGLGPR